MVGLDEDAARAAVAERAVQDFETGAVAAGIRRLGFRRSTRWAGPASSSSRPSLEGAQRRAGELAEEPVLAGHPDRFADDEAAAVAFFQDQFVASTCSTCCKEPWMAMQSSCRSPSQTQRSMVGPGAHSGGMETIGTAADKLFLRGARGPWAGRHLAPDIDMPAVPAPSRRRPRTRHSGASHHASCSGCSRRDGPPARRVLMRVKSQSLTAADPSRPWLAAAGGNGGRQEARTLGTRHRRCQA